LGLEKTSNGRINQLEQNTNQIFKVVFERMDEIDEKLLNLEEQLTPKLPNNRKKIGLKNNK